MKVHLIAVGGAIMHNLAIALKRNGYELSGSDDAIYDPAKSNLEREGLLPGIGWDPNRITTDLDFVILGMHARADNPELLRAQELGITIYSFPAFIAEHSKNKTRIVVAGSHGKTSTTSMIMHVLRKLGKSFDYLVGAKIQDFELSVQLSDAPIIIIEGDEYLSSALDRRSKFVWYEPHFAIITGIAWDHINVFPTFESYLETFQNFIATIPKNGHLFWFEEDEHLQKLMLDASCENNSYTTPDHSLVQGKVQLAKSTELLSIFGKHNLQNMQSAILLCEKLDITREAFLEAISDFVGAGKRLELILEKNDMRVFRDFAHAPSKLAASVKAVKEYQTKNKLLAVFELHTFSSLNKDFLPQYANSMQMADRAIVFYDQDIFAHRKLEVLAAEDVKKAFGDVVILHNPEELHKICQEEIENESTILLMSSGTFKGMSLDFKM